MTEEVVRPDLEVEGADVVGADAESADAERIAASALLAARYEAEHEAQYEGMTDSELTARAALLAADGTRWHRYRSEDVCWDEMELLYGRKRKINAIAHQFGVNSRTLYARKKEKSWRPAIGALEFAARSLIVAKAKMLRRAFGFSQHAKPAKSARPKRLTEQKIAATLPAAASIALPDGDLPPTMSSAGGEVLPWTEVAHQAQLAPDGAWRTWLLMGGRGAGKTRAGAEWVRALVEAGLAKRIALVGPTLHDVCEVMIAGPSGLCAIGDEAMRPKYEVTRRRLVWPPVGACAGAVAFAFSAEDPQSLRGPQFDLAWCDEIGAWARDLETWNTLAFAMRLGSAPRIVATTTPRPRALVKLLAEKAQRNGGGVTVTRANTRANAANLSPDFVAALEEDYAGTELGRQELDGELIEDLEGAMWSREMIETTRASFEEADGLQRIVVAVDPPAGASERSDACGIIVAGVKDGVVYVLADATARGLKPAGWAERVMQTAASWGAALVVAEGNQGGEMVRDVLSRADGNGPRVKLRHAHMSKERRAAPVSTLYAKGRVRHVRVLKELEDEMCAFGVAGAEGRRARSPDRVDALVWAVDELIARRPRSRPRLDAF